MTEQPPSAEAYELAKTVSYTRSGRIEFARKVDALCEQLVSAEAKRIVEIIKAIAKLYVDEVEFDTGWRMACERIMLHIPASAQPKTQWFVDPPRGTKASRVFDEEESAQRYANECPPHTRIVERPASPTTTAETRWQATLEAEKAAILDFVVDGKIGDDPSPPAVVDYTERARDALNATIARWQAMGHRASWLASFTHEAMKDVTAALSAVASEHQAAAIRAFGKRVWSDTEDVAYQAGAADERAALLARLREPETVKALAAFLAEGDQDAYMPEYEKRADAALAVITEKLT